jgi:hypothetical protein
MIYAEMEFVGLKEAIKALNDIDKSARRKLTRDYKEICQPVIDQAKRNIPNKAPISGWERNWHPVATAQSSIARGGFVRRTRDAWAEVERQERRRERRELPGALPWDQGAAERNIKARVSTKKPREALVEGRTFMANLAVFTIAWSGATNAIYDLAGRTSRGATKAGANMIRGLEARHGKASRVLWPAFEANRDEVELRMQRLIDDVLRQVNSEI